MRKFLIQLKNFLAVDYGWREFLHWLITTALIASIFGLGRGLQHRKDGSLSFDWPLFFAVVGGVILINVVSNLWDALARGKKLVGPVHGQKWRTQRKIAAAAILQRVNERLDRKPVDPEELQVLLADLLDCIVLHIRDVRGSHREDKVDVFANLLLVDGDELVVVARDSNLQGEHFYREIPKRYPSASMVAGRAITAGCALSVGDLTAEYREAPRNKPYRSILAVPVIASDGETRLGALSIDSSRPYFFQTFQQGKVENELENGLQPYVHTLTLILEGLISREPSEILLYLLTQHGAAETDEAQPRESRNDSE